MTVVCATCHTENRDRAMFCRGCAGKLPAFAATAPSALEAIGAPSPARAAAAPTRTARHTTTSHHATTRALLLAVLLLGATVLALAAWISFGPERSAAPGIASAAAPLAPQVSPAAPLKPLATPTVVPTAPIIAAAPPVPMPVESTLSPGESTVPANAGRSRAAPADSNAPTTRPPQPQRVAAAGGTSTASDPRVGCERLFFVLAARCEASHCDQAAYSRHPRCSVVREQRRQDEARRNLSSGF